MHSFLQNFATHATNFNFFYERMYFRMNTGTPLIVMLGINYHRLRIFQSFIWSAYCYGRVNSRSKSLATNRFKTTRSRQL
jgi:hypothetical protein